MASVYLLHFDKPFEGTPRKPNAKKRGFAQHYLGFANHLDARIEHHRNGTGANLTKYAVRAGCELQLARVWDHATRKTERKLKNNRHNSRMCPICHPVTAWGRGKRVQHV